MAKKYIDAEKLKEDIQANLAAISFNDDYQEGYEACGMSVLKSIESLQQEQQEEDLEKEMDKFFGMYRNSKGETFDITDGHHCFDWKEEESAESDMRIARHFYELGKNSKQ